MTRDEFKALVIDEATKLKKEATKEELGRLDFDTLSGRSRHHCIYGQMTGDCYSKRAAELLVECAKSVNTSYLYQDLDLHEVREMTVAYCPIFKRYDERDFSAIECSIILIPEWNQPLINYLKDITQELNLD